METVGVTDDTNQTPDNRFGQKMWCQFSTLQNEKIYVGRAHLQYRDQTCFLCINICWTPMGEVETEPEIKLKIMFWKFQS